MPAPPSRPPRIPCVRVCACAHACPHPTFHFPGKLQCNARGSQCQVHSGTPAFQSPESPGRSQACARRLGGSEASGPVFVPSHKGASEACSRVPGRGPRPAPLGTGKACGRLPPPLPLHDLRRGAPSAVVTICVWQRERRPGRSAREGGPGRGQRLAFGGWEARALLKGAAAFCPQGHRARVTDTPCGFPPASQMISRGPHPGPGL